MHRETNHTYAVILAGGSGQRLWPLSQAARPKQLVPVLEGKSLLEIAVERLEGVVPPSHRWICSGKDFEAQIRKMISSLGTYVAEPQGRDTLPAIALSCALAQREDPEAIVAILTSDHVIRPVDSFQKALMQAYQLVASKPDLLVTFGVTPTWAATGYGYLELAGPLPQHPEALLLKQFKEKPEKTLAETYLASGPEHYLWNSGMFVWKASRFLTLLERYVPETAAAIKRIVAAYGQADYEKMLSETYSIIKKQSVDYGIMGNRQFLPVSRGVKSLVSLLHERGEGCISRKIDRFTLWQGSPTCASKSMALPRLPMKRNRTESSQATILSSWGRLGES